MIKRFLDLKDLHSQNILCGLNRSPHLICQSNLFDQGFNLRINRWPPCLSQPGQSGSEKLEAFSMPADDSFRFDDQEGRTPLAQTLES